MWVPLSPGKGTEGFRDRLSHRPPQAEGMGETVRKETPGFVLSPMPEFSKPDFMAECLLSLLVSPRIPTVLNPHLAGPLHTLSAPPPGMMKPQILASLSPLSSCSPGQILRREPPPSPGPEECVCDSLGLGSMM